MRERETSATRMISILFVAGLLGIIASPIEAGQTIVAATCEAVAVQEAIVLASDGDTVVVPAGTCTWTTYRKGYAAVSIFNKALTLAGSGVDKTIIIGQTNGGCTACVQNEIPLFVDSQLGKAVRITGFTFKSSPVSPTLVTGFVHVKGSSQTVRIDHIKFDHVRGRAIWVAGHVFGVIDHCQFFYDVSQAMWIEHPTVDGSTWGDGSWKAPLTLGSSRALYVENSDFNYTGVSGRAAIDGGAGARYVFRYNTVSNSYVINHGTETSGRKRSTFSVEIYKNTFQHDSNWFTAVHLRGGTGVIFDNTASGFNGMIVLDNYRSHKAYAPWGRCDGTNKYDGNQDSSGYPCIDQIGRSTDTGLVTAQSHEPVFAWRNTLNGAGAEVRSKSPQVLEGRDFYNNTVRPGYSPYIYPHPLTLGSTTLAPPSGLTVK